VPPSCKSFELNVGLRIIEPSAKRPNLGHSTDPPSIPEAVFVHLANHGVLDG
jgi:hypothetical protein